MGEELFADVASMDFLGFDFPGTNYTKMLAEQQALLKSKALLAGGVQ